MIHLRGMKSRILLLTSIYFYSTYFWKELPFALEYVLCILSPAMSHWKRLLPTHLSPSIVDQFHRPPPFILNPHKYPSICVTRGQLLVWLIPSHQHNLENNQEGIYHREWSGGPGAGLWREETRTEEKASSKGMNGWGKLWGSAGGQGTATGGRITGN